MAGEASQCAIELAVIGAIVLHGAASLVRDGYHAIDVGILLQQVGRAKPLGDVLCSSKRSN